MMKRSLTLQFLVIYGVAGRLKRNLILAATIVFLVSHCHGAKMLAFFPFPGKSHHAAFRVIFTELANRGHQIDYYSPFPMTPPHRNINYIPVRDISMDLVGGLGGDILDEHYSLFRKIMFYVIMRNVTLQTICNMDEVKNLIKSQKKYDLVLHESHFVQEYTGVLAHKFNATSVVLMSSGDFSTANELAGLPDNTAYMVDNRVLLGDRMTFFERLYNTYATVMIGAANYLDLYRIQAKVDECFKYPGWETRPSLAKIASNDALILINSHLSVGFSYPKAPHVKEIGGVNIIPPKPLPKELDLYMNDAKEGVVYFSFGSVFDMSQMLGPEFRDIFSNVFSRLKEKVLWKWNGETWPGVPSNVKLSKWFPQQDVLAHKNTKLFITHGGLLSSFETTYSGVPALVMPLFGDQHKNALRMKEAGYSEQIKISELTEDLLYRTIRKMIDDSKYKKEALRRSELFKDRPMKPVDEAVYWIEYVLKHGRVLQPAAVHLSFFQLHLLDVYAFAVASILVIYFAAKKTLILFGSKIFPKKITVSNIKKKS